MTDHEQTQGEPKRTPLGLKIVSDQRDVTDAKVYALIDGQELDISRIIQKVDVKLHVGELATANLQCIVYNVETKALLEQAEITEYRRPRFWKIRRRLGDARREVTSFASRYGAREYVR